MVADDARPTIVPLSLRDTSSDDEDEPPLTANGLGGGGGTARGDATV
jgi:hypothetical protein